MPFPTMQICSFFIGEESICITKIYTITDFGIATSSSADYLTTTVIYSTRASKAPSTKSAYADSSSIHHVYTVPMATNASLG